MRLERTLGLDEAVVVPSPSDVDQTAKGIGLALGKFLSEAIRDNMTIGVGWGRTLTASLANFRPPRLDGVTVMSLLGGAVESRFTDPVEYSWRLANALGAECYLFPAPLIVDSPATKQRLIDACGIDRLYALGEHLDLVIVSVGDIGPAGTSLASHLVSSAELTELVALGSVGDVMCNFLDENGRTVTHPISDRVMSIGVDTLKKADHIVIASGGANRGKAILAAIRRIGCNTLVTDEAAATALLALVEAEPSRALKSVG